MNVKSDMRRFDGPDGRKAGGEADPRTLLPAHLKLCRGALKRLRRTLLKQEAELREAERWVEYRQVADTLLANPAAFPRGCGTVRVDNIHTGEPVEMKLNPKLDAADNAQLLYKKARKGERGAGIAAEKVACTRQRIERVAELIEQGEALKAERDDPGFAGMVERFAETVRDEGIEGGGALHNRPTTHAPRIPYRHYVIRGWDVYIGKNTTQNDELTTRFAKPRDIWMHVAAHSGSHVVIRRAKDAQWPPKAVIEEVASLAVWFSKARHTSYAEVHVTEARFVHKPRKSPPGQVVAERCKTVRVAPVEPARGDRHP
jgi:predicted ribosome quality control (RQC) complex YloA/Tae2 family protein